MQHLITNSYEHALACAYDKISQRGLLFNREALRELESKVIKEIGTHLTEISKGWGMYVYVKDVKPDVDKALYAQARNINSTQGKNSLINTLKELGFNLPKTRKKDKEGNFEHKESSDEPTLRQVFADTGDENIKRLLRVRELNKLLGTYIRVDFFNDCFMSQYNVAATVTGRRGCTGHIFGFGGNAQTFPKHSEIAGDYRECVIARPGTIYLSADQESAEDWPVSALAENHRALDQLRATTWPEKDRHSQLAAFIFTIPIHSRTEKEWKKSIERYLGKKTRHANNYGMQGKRLSLALAGEGFSFDEKVCKAMLEKVGQYDPNIKNVFHQFIRNCIERNRTLVTPFGRERQFFGFRPGSPNYELFNEAYSYIPQSLVGDNTGLAILYLDGLNNNYIVQESHDSILQEVPEVEAELITAFTQVRESFNRKIIFHNGIEVQIPVEGEMGYNLNSMTKISDFSVDGMLETWKRLKAERDASNITRVMVG